MVLCFGISREDFITVVGVQTPNNYVKKMAGDMITIRKNMFTAVFI